MLLIGVEGGVVMGVGVGVFCCCWWCWFVTGVVGADVGVVNSYSVDVGAGVGVDI